MSGKSVLIALSLAACLAGLPPTPAAAQPARPRLEALPPDARAVVERWLEQDCGAGEGEETARMLAATGAVFEPAFLEAYSLGPPAERLAAVRVHAQKAYRQRRAWLSAGEAPWLPPELRRGLLDLSEADYVAEVAANAVNAYRSAAVRALGLVGTIQSYRVLQQAAADPEAPGGFALSQALKLLRQRVRP